eukprot:gene5726-5789_t
MPNTIAKIEACIPALRRYARALQRGQDPDDLVQETLVRALGTTGDRQPDGEVRPWLFAIMHNLSISDRRRASVRRHTTSMDLVDEGAMSIRSRQEDALHWQDFMRAFDSIPEDQRQVLLLVSIEDLSYAEVAQVLGIPLGTVMSRLSRGRERLRALTGAEGEVSRDPSPVGEDGLHAYVDNQLDAARRVEVERYLQAHPAVARRVQIDQVQRDQIRKAFSRFDDEAVPPHLRIAELRQTVPQAERRRLPWRAAAAVVLALFTGAAGGLWVGSRPTGPFIRLAAETAANYAVYSTDKRRPVELWAAQRDDLNRWVSNRLNRPVSAPDLAAMGYQFLGGRLVPTAQGAGAMFMYENGDGVRLVLLVRPMGVPRTSKIEQVRIGDMEGCAWADGEMGFGMVGAEPFKRLLEVSSQVRLQFQS